MVLTARRLLVGWCGNIVITKFYDSINTESEKTLKY